MVISRHVNFSTVSIHHTSKVVTNPRSRSRFRNPKVAITSILLVAIVAIGARTVLQSQSSSAAVTPLSLSPEHLAWQLQITGLVRNDINLTVEELLQMPPTSVEAAIYCLPSPDARQGYFQEGGKWTGVKLRDILDQAGVLAETQKIVFYASDGFTTDLPVDVARAENVIIAFGKDGSPLSQHVRLVVPGRWGYKWIHSLMRIEAVDYDYKGRYEQNGFPDDAINTAHPDL